MGQFAQQSLSVRLHLRSSRRAYCKHKAKNSAPLIARRRERHRKTQWSLSLVWLLRDGVERMWAFSNMQISAWTELNKHNRQLIKIRSSALNRSLFATLWFKNKNKILRHLLKSDSHTIVHNKIKSSCVWCSDVHLLYNTPHPTTNTPTPPPPPTPHHHHPHTTPPKEEK